MSKYRNKRSGHGLLWWLFIGWWWWPCRLICYDLPKLIVKGSRPRQAQNRSPVNPSAPAPVKPSTQETYVFLTTKGKKFHYDPCCPSIINSKAIKMDISKARNAGYRACDKCCYSYLHDE